MRNKIAKQMIADVTMNGRSLFWCGETAEIFVAHNGKIVSDEYDDPKDHPDDLVCEKIKTNWKSLWKPCLSEECIGGAKLHNGGVYYIVPTISTIPKHNDSHPAPQIFTDYN